MKAKALTVLYVPYSLGSGVKYFSRVVEEWPAPPRLRAARAQVLGVVVLAPARVWGLLFMDEVFGVPVRVQGF